MHQEVDWVVRGMPQFSPITGRPQHGYARYNHNDIRYPPNRYNYRPEVSYNEGESRATLAVAEALNKLTANFAKMQKQPLATVALSTFDWFDGTDTSNTMSWLEQVEVVAERNTQAPLEVGMAKLKGAPLHDIYKIHDLIWPCLQKLLIENYSNTPYISDMMVAYNRISQAEDKSVSQYLICANDYLECIYHTSRLSSMDGSGRNHISLVQGLSDHYIRRRASKDAENWKTMEDAFNSITKIARTAGKTKACNKSRYKKPTDINAINHNYNNSQRGSFNMYQGTYKNNHGSNYSSRNNSQNNVPRQNSNKEPVCYHCAGPHYITNCTQYQKDKDRHKCTMQQVKEFSGQIKTRG